MGLNIKSLCCIFTMVHNENKFLKLWLDYYSRSFDKADIFVYDHCSDTPLGIPIGKLYNNYNSNIWNIYDKARLPKPKPDRLSNNRQAGWQKYNIQDTETDLPCVVKLLFQVRDQRPGPKYYNINWMQTFLRCEIAHLLKKYDYVVLADVDDYFFVNPVKYKNFREYISVLKLRGIENSRATGYELVHQEFELDLDWNKKIFGLQRNYWMRFGMWDKTLINSKQIPWTRGFHYVINNFDPPDDDLILCHLQRVDFEHRLAKTKQNIYWNRGQTEKNLDKPENLADFKKRFHDNIYRKKFEKINVLQARQNAGDTVLIRGKIVKIPDKYMEWLVI